MNEQPLADFPETELDILCRRYHVRRLAFFGSAIRDDFGPTSDIDVLVEFQPGRTPGFAFARLQRELSRLLGRPVDLHTPRSLSRYFRDEVLRTARIQYEAPSESPQTR
ncbi:nucleotidyltransferase family protein [Tepidiphilus baoligensis]|uniref:Nucleotidyltransferase n=1 Tax=Tepidiphilus baoligensis TaxID=2698687 RepID=A0ABX1QJT4_9PROT|nr:nucleotidyltransferase [Tepidiphilus baoligensis]